MDVEHTSYFGEDGYVGITGCTCPRCRALDRLTLFERVQQFTDVERVQFLRLTGDDPAVLLEMTAAIRARGQA